MARGGSVNTATAKTVSRRSRRSTSVGASSSGGRRRRSRSATSSSRDADSLEDARELDDVEQEGVRKQNRRLTDEELSKDRRLQPLVSAAWAPVVQVYRLAFMAAIWYIVRLAWTHGIVPRQPSRFMLLVWIPFAIHLVCFWSVSGAFAWVDFTHTPRFVYMWKIQKKSHVPTGQYLEGAARVLFVNQIGIALPLSVMAEKLAPLSLSDELPDPFTCLWHLIVFALIWEFCFYYLHRLFHHPDLYQYIHKRHHLFKATVALASEYAHPIEFAFGNSIPLMLGPILLKSHVTMQYFWLAQGIITTCFSHSGYMLPFSPIGDARQHDYHHFAFNKDFGSLGILDWLHGTTGGYKPRDMRRA